MPLLRDSLVEGFQGASPDQLPIRIFITAVRASDSPVRKNDLRTTIRSSYFTSSRKFDAGWNCERREFLRTTGGVRE